jgi:hypothetical protein
MTSESEPKSRRLRSPSYPAIPLGAAVEKTKELYKHEKSYPTHIDTVLKHWGYRPKSGSGLVAIAAVLKFGLIDDEGSGSTRRARVSELGLRIVRDTREDSPERDRLLREAALLPSIHRDLWEKYDGSLPSDANLEYTLRMEYHFTDLGATEFVREFRSTIAYARLDERPDEDAAEPESFPTARSQSAPPNRVGEVHERVPHRVTSLGAARQNLMILPLPVAGLMVEEWPSLNLPRRLTSDAQWEQMVSVLTAMKGGIVEPAAQATAGLASATAQAHDPTVIIESGAPAGD